MNRSHVKILRASILCTLFVVMAGCYNQAVLEPDQCVQSRDVVKQFYSFHVGNDMTPTEENLKRRKKYLSEKVYEEAGKGKKDSKFDYFTQTEEYPRAIRVAKCKSSSDNQATFDVLLFWRDGTEKWQRIVSVDVVKENSGWLIDRVSKQN